MTPPPIIKDLANRFENNRDAYHSSGYNETQLRREFLDPFFKALGWDVDNEQGYSEAYKDVIHEDQIKVGGGTKAPDYCFRIGGTRKFFVEAKKPAVNLKEDVSPAFQLRRYAWSAKLPLSILTDFEEFAVYDCRVRPDKTDKASAHRVMYFRYDEYLEKWDEIVGIFSREEVLKGSFDKYAESMRRKKGTAEVDAAFLSEIETWRNELARNLALRNKDLSQRELNFAVSRTIDRIIFLRVCEDRGIEPYGQLQELLSKKDVYPQLFDIFRRADERYNSGLFYFKKEKERPGPPDELTPSLTLDDKKLKDIIRSLYYPDSPYEFSVLPADILGQVYEQFLGKVIRLTKGHQAKVEDKPEVKKAGGVYYTPTYIVDYIVKHTVGKLLEDKTPKQAAKLRILDPACGSGSFLIGAYQYLLDWHLKYYEEDGPAKHRKQIYQVKKGEWRLTTAERKRILLNNIYGVDIDPQAVEVTKLSLLLKVLEGESRDTIESQLRMFRERALPDLSSNIKCGNSLIGPDFYEHEQMTLLDDEERYRINAFDWQTEFANIMKAGGFDAVIGNPPYGASVLLNETTYLRNEFKDASQSLDSFELFLVKASRLLKQSGRLSMIIPASWLTGDNYVASRKSLIACLNPIVAYAMPFDVFKAAYIDTAIVVFVKDDGYEQCLVHYFPKKDKLAFVPAEIGTEVPIDNIRSDNLFRISTILSKNAAPILDKLKSCSYTFGDWFIIQRGVQPYSRKKHSEKQIKQRFLHAKSELTKDHLPELQGSELSRYWVSPKRMSFIHFCDEIASLRLKRMFEGKRIVLRRLITRKFRLQASKVKETMVTTDNVLNMIPKSEEADVGFALGILNSNLVSWYYVNKSMVAQKDDFPQVHISALANLPIPVADKARHDKMVKLVERMLKLNRELQKAKTPDEKTRLERQITATDRQIDKLVYELYSLTEDEIKIVEGGG